MKKTFGILLSLMMVCVAILASPTTTANAQVPPQYSTQATQSQTEQVTQIFKDFANKNLNRFSFGADSGDGEKKASEYIKNTLVDMGYSADQITVHSFSKSFSSVSIMQSEEQTYNSQNVILSLSASDSSVRNKVIIGCDYDNLFGQTNYNPLYGNTISDIGAIDNASAVATLLYLSQNLLGVSLPVNLEIAFFGAGYYSYSGATAYIDDFGLSNVSGFINVARIGLPQIYVYGNETNSPLENHILSTTNFLQKMPSTVPLINAEVIDGYSYMHIGMQGNQVHFMTRGVATANIFGGDNAYLGLKWNIINDSIENMEKQNPDCYINMANVGNYLSMLIADNQLLDVCLETTQNTSSPFTDSWYAIVILGIVMAVAMLVTWALARHFSQKYPFVTTRKVTPVFGAEYE